MSDQSNLAELEQRITSALARIGAGLDKLGDGNAAATEPVAQSVDTSALKAEISKLKTELAAENAVVVQLKEQLTAENNADQPSESQLEAKVEKMTHQLDIQGLELQRMRKATVQLREHLRVLHEAAAENVAEPQLINKAMQAELDSLRATRHTEIAEMDEILAELKPLIEEASANA